MLKNTHVRHVALDKWFPLNRVIDTKTSTLLEAIYGHELSDPDTGICLSAHRTCDIYGYACVYYIAHIDHPHMYT